MRIDSQGCTQQTVLQVDLEPLYCCLEGTSYGAVVTNNVRSVCFKSLESACVNPNWGFYIPYSGVTSSSSFTLVAGTDNDDCRQGTVVGDVAIACTADQATGKPTSVTFTVTNFAASVITAQNYFVGCQPITSCSPPKFGAFSDFLGCTVGSQRLFKGGGIVTVTSCGGAIPAVQPVFDGAVKTQTFAVRLTPDRSADTGCLTCNDVKVVLQQSGSYRGNTRTNQCDGF